MGLIERMKFFMATKTMEPKLYCRLEVYRN